MRFGQTKGFTLIELLVVVSVIIILIVGILDVLYNARKQARDRARISDSEQLKLGLSLYKEANGKYPAYDAGIQVGVGGAIDTLIQPFLTKINNDPLGTKSGIGVSEYAYWYYSNFTCGGTKHNVIVVKKMELQKNANYNHVCLGLPYLPESEGLIPTAYAGGGGGYGQSAYYGQSPYYVQSAYYVQNTYYVQSTYTYNQGMYASYLQSAYYAEATYPWADSDKGNLYILLVN